MAEKQKSRGRYPRAKRAALALGALFVVLTGISYARALLAPNSPGWDLRTAEWVRENHLGWALDFAEWVSLAVHPPSEAELAETELSAFPEPFARQREDFKKTLSAPAPLKVQIEKPMPGEGAWVGVGSTVNGVPALRCTYFHPDATCPNVAVAVARFTPELARFVLVPGTRDPGGEWRWHGGIPEEERASLVAAFNAGFRLRDAHGGLYAEGSVAIPLVAGAASLVIDQAGAADIVAWTEDRKLTPEIAAVRQNLELIVIDGKFREDLLGNRCFKGVFRSGLGITSEGALVYVAGHGLTLGTLALALIETGAVRGMETDIHGQWPSFNVFQPTAGAGSKVAGTKLLKNMQRPANRYLKPDDRDFIAAFVR